jgi:hypothetical protein
LVPPDRGRQTPAARRERRPTGGGGDEPDQADRADNLAVTAVLALARAQVALAEQRRRGEDEENGGKSEPGRMSKKSGKATGQRARDRQGPPAKADRMIIARPAHQRSAISS